MAAADEQNDIADELRAFLSDPAFPCVGARAALRRQQVYVHVADDFVDPRDDAAIVARVQSFSCSYKNDDLFSSLIIVFAEAPPLGEVEFERQLWQRIQGWHEIDQRDFGWDSRVDPDPNSLEFAMSFGGRGYFLVGLHPAASRPARRFSHPALAFNLQEQFSALRLQGRYDAMKSAITERDTTLAGTPNPMLAEHGTASAARQYSGRSVDANWVCPFAARVRRDGWA